MVLFNQSGPNQFVRGFRFPLVKVVTVNLSSSFTINRELGHWRNPSACKWQMPQPAIEIDTVHEIQSIWVDDCLSNLMGINFTSVYISSIKWIDSPTASRLLGSISRESFFLHQHADDAHADLMGKQSKQKSKHFNQFESLQCKHVRRATSARQNVPTWLPFLQSNG